jgi:hypothetical protein
LGLSKYDGTTFVHFENKLQAGRAISHINQDKTGRIWCSNFAGDIFYVENDTLKKLDTYLHEKGNRYAQIDYDSLSNRIYSTSSRGLFSRPSKSQF